jgi:RNA polymerase sigma-70 factor (ECF subfamily)
LSIYERDAAGLFRYAIALAPDRETARDAVQEIFLRYFIARGEGQQFENPKAWLFRVLRNHLLDAIRACRTKNEVGIENACYFADRHQNPEVCYQQAEMTRRVSSSLTERELECVRLRAEGLRYEEIADVLAVRPGTVAALMARAHKKIRRVLYPTGYVSQHGARTLSLLALEETPHAS